MKYRHAFQLNAAVSTLQRKGLQNGFRLSGDIIFLGVSLLAWFRREDELLVGPEVDTPSGERQRQPQRQRAERDAPHRPGKDVDMEPLHEHEGEHGVHEGGVYGLLSGGCHEERLEERYDVDPSEPVVLPRLHLPPHQIQGSDEENPHGCYPRLLRKRQHGRGERSAAIGE